MIMYIETKEKTIIKKITWKDNLFQGRYTIDPYRNCEFRCTYCDSASDIIYVKTNIYESLEEELKDIEIGRIIIGSVYDPYQPAEKTYQLTRELLYILRDRGYPVHILTKSPLVLRDLDILSDMNSIVTFTIISLKPDVVEYFEKFVPSVTERLEAMYKLSKKGITTGVALIPILPYIIEDELEDIIKKVKEYKGGYLLHKYLELKGDQRNIFLSTLKEIYPSLSEKYYKLYKESYLPSNEYQLKINKIIKSLCKEYKLRGDILLPA